MDHNPQSLSRRPIELRMALAELNRKLERLTALPSDELSQRRLAKQRAKMRQQSMRQESELDPLEPA